MAATIVPSAGPGVEPEAAGLGPSPPPDQAGVDAGDRFRMFDAVATLLLGAAGAQPVLMVLDDLQWARGSSPPRPHRQ